MVNVSTNLTDQLHVTDTTKPLSRVVGFERKSHSSVDAGRKLPKPPVINRMAVPKLSPMTKRTERKNEEKSFKSFIQQGKYFFANA